MIRDSRIYVPYGSIATNNCNDTVAATDQQPCWAFVIVSNVLHIGSQSILRGLTLSRSRRRPFLEKLYAINNFSTDRTRCKLCQWVRLKDSFHGCIYTCGFETNIFSTNCHSERNSTLQHPGRVNDFQVTPENGNDHRGRVHIVSNH